MPKKKVKVAVDDLTDLFDRLGLTFESGMESLKQIRKEKKKSRLAERQAKFHRVSLTVLGKEARALYMKAFRKKLTKEGREAHNVPNDMGGAELSSFIMKLYTKYTQEEREDWEQLAYIKLTNMYPDTVMIIKGSPDGVAEMAGVEVPDLNEESESDEELL